MVDKLNHSCPLCKALHNGQEWSSTPMTYSRRLRGWAMLDMTGAWMIANDLRLGNFNLT